MIYLLPLMMIVAGYYTFTYGVTAFKNEHNKLSGFGTCLLAVVGTILPIVVLFLKR